MLAISVDKSLTISDSLLLSLVGFIVVFIALVSLIAVIKVISALSDRKKSGGKLDADSAKSKSFVPVSTDAVPASGSSGELVLYDVDDHTAALIMAIVADNLQVPLNTLRFTSIRYIEEVR